MTLSKQQIKNHTMRHRIDHAHPLVENTEAQLWQVSTTQTEQPSLPRNTPPRKTLLLRFPQRPLKRLLNLTARNDRVLPHVGETVERIARTPRPQLDDSP